MRTADHREQLRAAVGEVWAAHGWRKCWKSRHPHTWNVHSSYEKQNPNTGMMERWRAGVGHFSDDAPLPCPGKDVELPWECCHQHRQKEKVR